MINTSRILWYLTYSTHEMLLKIEWVNLKTILYFKFIIRCILLDNQSSFISFMGLQDVIVILNILVSHFDFHHFKNRSTTNK